MQAVTPTLVRRRWTVGVLLFDEVEVLDFAAPFEVFSVAGARSGPPPFDVFTCAERRSHVTARNQLRLVPSFTLDEMPHIDVLVVPGGYGTRRELSNERLTRWLSERARDAEILLSVCSGALLLAVAGLLRESEATTHQEAKEQLAALDATIRVCSAVRFVDAGRVITSAGVSAGIDASLHVVGRLLGPSAAAETATYMEYEGNWQVG